MCISWHTKKPTVFEQQFLKQKNSPTHHRENKFLIFSLKTKRFGAARFAVFIYMSGVHVLRVLVWCPVRSVEVLFIAGELYYRIHCPRKASLQSDWVVNIVATCITKAQRT